MTHLVSRCDVTYDRESEDYSEGGRVHNKTGIWSRLCGDLQDNELGGGCDPVTTRGHPCHDLCAGVTGSSGSLVVLILWLG